MDKEPGLRKNMTCMAFGKEGLIQEQYGGKIRRLSSEQKEDSLSEHKL
jgi:hypothetical protein